LTRLLTFITDHAGWVLAIVLAITVLSITQIVDVRTGELRIAFDPSTNALLPQDDEGRRFYDYVRTLFGSDETVLVVLVDDDIFTAENLKALQRMAERIETIHGVHHVVSLGNALNIRSQDGDLIIEPFVDVVPSDPTELAEIRRRALENPIYAGNLVSRDGTAAALMVYLMEMTEGEFLDRGIDREIARIADQEKGDATVWITGQAYVKAEMSRTLLKDLLRTVPLAAAAMIIVALISFRSLFGALIPLTGVGIALVWTLAIFAARGESLNVITVVLPPLILVVGFAYSIHVVAEYYDMVRQGHAQGSKREAVAKALKLVALPVVLTGATTGAGFLSLAISPLTAIREFGLYATAGVLITMLVALTFAPAILCVLPAPKRLTQKQGPDGFERLARILGAFAVRRRVAILATGAVVGVFSAAMIANIHISTDMVRLFDPESPVRVHFEAINKHLEGSDAIYVVLDTDYRNAFKEPVNLAAIEELQRWLEEQPNVGGTTSLVDYVKLIHRAFYDDDPAKLVIPESKELITQLMFFGANDEVDSFVDSRYQTVNILVRSTAIDSADMTQLVAAIEARLDELPPHLTGHVTGNSVLINKTSDDIAYGQAVSLGLAGIIIYGMLCLLFMSFRIGFLALIPNALPVVVYFGILGVTGITLNTTTGLVACLVLGIAVDDTIHFLVRFNSAAKKLADETKGVVEALWAVGRPVTYTSAALCLGFLAIGVTSTLQNQREFGVLAAFTLGVAWLVDIVFTPALAARMRVVTLWDVLTLDLGEAPQRAIPLFQGMSQSQARIAALMTSILHYPAGHELTRTGEEADDMFVVIDGKLSVTVPTKDGSMEVPLGRGDVIGEVGFFHGKRSADVRVAEPATLLRLTHENLARLQKRYPRIGAQIYRNLNHVLAERLAHSTARTR